MDRLLDLLVVSLLRAAAVLLAPLSLLAWRPITTTSPTAEGIQSVFLGPARLNRLQAALVPEALWIRLGVQLATRLDWRVGGTEARAIRTEVGRLLAEVRDDPATAAVAPALPLAVWGRALRPDHGHLFAYRPEPRPGERLGLLVFLHGHGGNAVPLPHLLRPWADRHRHAVVCPSFGYGNWDRPGAAGCVGRALDFALTHLAGVDPDRVTLAGVSQGGAGVGRAGAALAGRLARLVFVSPTLEPAVLTSAAFVAGWRGRGVTVVHGTADRHVSWKHVTRGVSAMAAAGVPVRFDAVAGGTHFLLVADLERLAGLLMLG